MYVRTEYKRKTAGARATTYLNAFLAAKRETRARILERWQLQWPANWEAIHDVYGQDEHVPPDNASTNRENALVNKAKAANYNYRKGEQYAHLKQDVGPVDARKLRNAKYYRKRVEQKQLKKRQHAERNQHDHEVEKQNKRRRKD